MGHAGWADIWSLLLAHIGAQAIEVRILIGLGAAFTALMIVEGLRASFLPRRAMPSAGVASKPAGVLRPEKTVTHAPFRPRPAPAAVPKRAKVAVKAHQTERPRIKRQR